VGSPKKNVKGMIQISAHNNTGPLKKLPMLWRCAHSPAMAL